MNTKSMPQEAEAIMLTTRNATPLVSELALVRNQLAAITLSTTKPSLVEHRQQVETLQKRVEELQQQIGMQSLTVEQVNPWIPTGRLIQQIPPKTVFVNFSRFAYYPPEKFAHFKNDFTAWAPPNYYAWVVPAAGGGDVIVVDLGEAAIIDEQIELLRNRLQPSELERIALEGERAAEAGFRQQSAELSKLIFAPLEKHLSGIEQIILSPDGDLWTVPWGALLTKNDKYVTEEYRTSYVLTGRELVNVTKEDDVQNMSVIFADPDYDQPAAQAQPTSPSVRRTGSRETNSLYRNELRTVRGRNFSRLPSSAAEAAAIKPSLENYTQSECRVLLQDAAAEVNFKQLRGPRVLVLSTHGYYVPDAMNVGESPEDKTYSNPLLRCGLALAGSNLERASSGADENAEDGILTGLEIVGADLRGTELVVLSACETGLGKIRGGEGVAGLRQAFQLAGAQSVVSSLWQVEDKETTHTMSLFFQGLANGNSKSQALREAQLARIESRRKRHGAAHPFFWAAFTLTGRE